MSLEDTACCNAPELTPVRRRLLKRAVGLEGFIVVYNVIEGVVAVIAGWLAGSIALIGFGIDSAIETAAAAIVLLRLWEEYRGHDPDTHVFPERRAEQFVAVTLFLLCGYIVIEAGRTMYLHHPPDTSTVGIVLASISVTVMPVVAVLKRRTGRILGSRALIADAAETMVCAYLSFTLLLGLTLNALLGWWWADPAAALIMVPLILREAWEAWRGDVEAP